MELAARAINDAIALFELVHNLHAPSDRAAVRRLFCRSLRNAHDRLCENGREISGMRSKGVGAASIAMADMSRGEEEARILLL